MRATELPETTPKICALIAETRDSDCLNLLTETAATSA